MLKKKIEDALNAQINAEMWSAYLYLSMAAYCHAQGQPGMGKWFEVQFKEEQDHAKILFNYVISRNGKVDLRPIEAVPSEENDYATQSMLQWFIDEQVEEEENVQTIIDNLKMIKDNGYGIYMIDKELGQRSYNPASPLA